MPRHEPVLESHDTSACVVVCGDERFFDVVSEGLGVPPDDVAWFSQGAPCRSHLAATVAPARVLVAPSLDDVAPVNLVAAIRDDGARMGVPREVVLYFEGEQTGSFTSRAHAAGAGELRELPVRTSACLEDDRLADLLLEEPDMSSRTPARHEASISAPPAESDRSGSRGEGVVLVVSSGSGGTGKSTLSLLAAIEIAERGLSCALVDLDVQFGDIAYLLGLLDYHALDEVAKALDEPGEAGSARLAGYAESIQGGVDFYAAPRRPELGDVVAPRAAQVVDALSRTHDVVVVNTGSFWSDAHVQVMARCDLCLLLVQQRLSAVRACVRALDLLGRLGVPRARCLCVLNRFDARAPMSSTDVSMALQGAALRTVSDGGGEVEELMGVGCPEELFSLRNSCATDVAGLVDAALESVGITSDRQVARRLIPEARRAGRFGEAREAR